ncbi:MULTISPECIES: expansin EXLX1 family cellulose-binding protein [unclassified Parafrankia]|uniref:expansin EXLX1 family cellulose-binding protein n=1 Tax=unclassified Parafrankia TaxID=2994368 RepID=UPI000DA4FAB2|nr:MULTISPECIES: expansin EXLX1 family cellulose-binding protein [unclassified Parafrankia]TCJ34367.1 hypothetical protein E0504_34590 [Parafrankia sp. BMG5.11]SQD95697.1 Rare lipoprotein A [Parafrankia sp. Ea1.12]
MSPAPGFVSPARRALLGVAAAAVVVLATGCQPAVGGGPPEPDPVSTATAASAPGPSSTPTSVPTASSAPSVTPVPSISPAPSAGPTIGGTAGPGTGASTAPTGPSAPPGRPSVTGAPAPGAPAGPTTVPVTPGRIQPGVVRTGPATHYGADGGGNCMFDRLTDPAMPVVAMNELDYETARACGAYIEVTGPGGTTVVKVTDRCPECGPGHLDLSQQAFARIAGGVPGLVDVTWRLVSPADIGSVQFRVKEGSSAYWLAIQVRNHRNPVVSLEVRVNGAWTALPREMWNYFVAPQGLGPGPFTVRITDVYGEQLVETVNLAPASVQTTGSQFARR